MCKLAKLLDPDVTCDDQEITLRHALSGVVAGNLAVDIAAKRVEDVRATVEACIALLLEDYDNALLASYQSGIGLCIANLRRQLPPPEATHPG